jgi:hypothetical protein
MTDEDPFITVDDSEAMAGADDCSSTDLEPAVVRPVPHGVERPEDAAFRIMRRQPDDIWRYRGADGQLLFVVFRYDLPGRRSCPCAGLGTQTVERNGRPSSIHLPARCTTFTDLLGRLVPEWS